MNGLSFIRLQSVAYFGVNKSQLIMQNARIPQL